MKIKGSSHDNKKTNSGEKKEQRTHLIGRPRRKDALFSNPNRQVVLWAKASQELAAGDGSFGSLLRSLSAAAAEPNLLKSVTASPFHPFHTSPDVHEHSLGLLFRAPLLSARVDVRVCEMGTKKAC